jgi:hypothetical protein
VVNNLLGRTGMVLAPALVGVLSTWLVPCLINKLAVVRKSGGGVPPPERPEAAPTLVRYNHWPSSHR